MHDHDGRNSAGRPGGATLSAPGGINSAPATSAPGKRTLLESVAPEPPEPSPPARVQRKEADATASAAPDVHAAAERGTSGNSHSLPHAHTIQQLFGRHNISGIQAHTDGSAGEGARAMGATAFATGNHVAFASPPDLHTAAHEAAHVVQQRGGVQLKGGVGRAGDSYEQHADAVADRVVAGRSAEDLLDGVRSGGTAQAVQRKEATGDAAVLEHQAGLKGTDVEIPALEGALLSTRLEAVRQHLLSQAAFNASLALSRAMTMLQPGVKANGPVDAGLREQAAVAARQLFSALQKETADDRNFRTLPSMGESPAISSQNPYTEEVHVTTSFLLWSSTHDHGSWLQQLPDLIRQSKWEQSFDGYRRMIEGLDLWVADQLRAKGKGTPDEALGNAHQYYGQLRTGLEQIADKHATRLPALFHPDPKTVEKDKAAGKPAAETIPMNVYFWTDAKDGKVHLYDLTTPGRPHEQPIDGPPTAAALNTFFEEVARYPEGHVRYTLPGGGSGVAQTTGKTKWYEWVGYAGLAIAAVGLALATGGASVPATICFAAGALAGGVSAVGHLADSERLGTATTASIVLDVAQIAASFASAGAMNITVKAGSAAAAIGSSRWFVPLVTGAASADVVQFVALTDITFGELSKIKASGGSPEDQQRAMAVLLTQLVVMGSLTALSVRGVRDVRALAGKPIEVAEQHGQLVMRIAGDGAPAEPTSTPNRVHGTSDDHGSAANQPIAPKTPVPPTHVAVPHEAKPPAEQAIAIVKKHSGSVRNALAELNQQGFTQAQMREALEAAWKATGRDTAGALSAQDGTLILLSRRVGPNQPVNLIRPDGVAEFGTGELFIDPNNLKSPIGVRNVHTSDGTPLLMPGETLRASGSATRATKASGELEAGASGRLEQLARDPDHGGKITDQTRREAKVVLELEGEGKLKPLVRRPVPGDGHSGDFVDGVGGDWDVKAYKSRQTIIDNIRAKAAAKGASPPKLDPAAPVPGEFELEVAMSQIRGELRGGERVIIDTEGLSPADLALLKAAVKRGNLQAQVIFHE